jgi:Meckel syndrome type 1 protein
LWTTSPTCIIIIISDGLYVSLQVHRLATWKPAGNINERMHTFFVGGAPELDDITYLATPAGFNGKALNKYGFAADASGEVKVRTQPTLRRKATRGEYYNAARGQ